MARAPIFFDIFAGAGGFSLGFSRAGFKCAGVVERDCKASETYRTNFPGHVDGSLAFLGEKEGDIEKIDFSGELREALENLDLDVLLAGPPCQGFSKVGRGKLDSLARKRGAFSADPRNALYEKFLELLEVAQPRAFVFENVAGILSLGGTNVAEAICLEAMSRGYRVRCTLLNAAWYGVPQTRERVFIIGTREDLGIEPSFPEPRHRADLTRGHLTNTAISKDLFSVPDLLVHTPNPVNGLPSVNARQALHDLPPFLEHLRDRDGYRAVRGRIEPRSYLVGRPSRYAELMRRWDVPEMLAEVVTDHYCRRTPRDYAIFGKMRHGDRYPDALQIARQRYAAAKRRHERLRGGKKPRRKDFVPPYPENTFPEKWRKLYPDKPSWTITAHLAKDCYSHIHYDCEQKRSITIREAARLQSFPDAFHLSGNMGDCFRQIGNAVPPLLAFELGSHLRELLGR